MPLKINGATSGGITLTTPAEAGTNTLTLPARTGNIITSADSGTVTQAMLASNVVGNGPAFAAYGTALQSIDNEKYTKVNFNTEEFDTNNNYDTVNYRFLPTVAGIYQIMTTITFGASATAGARGIIGIYVDGSIFRLSSTNLNTASNTNFPTSTLVKLNGSSNYVEIFMYQNSGGSLNCGSGSISVPFAGVLVRAN